MPVARVLDLVAEQNRRKPFRSLSGKSCNSKHFQNSPESRSRRSAPETMLRMTQPAPGSCLSGNEE